jgi:hypothetical protein
VILDSDTPREGVLANLERASSPWLQLAICRAICGNTLFGSLHYVSSCGFDLTQNEAQCVVVVWPCYVDTEFVWTAVARSAVWSAEPGEIKDQRDRQAHARWVVTMQGSATVRTCGITAAHTNKGRNAPAVGIVPTGSVH